MILLYYYLKKMEQREYYQELEKARTKACEEVNKTEAKKGFPIISV